MSCYVDRISWAFNRERSHPLNYFKRYSPG